MESDGSEETSPSLPPLAAATDAALAQASRATLTLAAGLSLSPFAAPWVPSSPVAAGLSAWGPQEMLPISDSEASSDELSEPSPIAAADKGKVAAAPGHKRRRRQSRNNGARFMANARHQPPPRARHNPSSLRDSRQTHHHPWLHVPRDNVRVDTDGFTLVESRCRWCRQERLRVSSRHPVSPTLVDLYFNYLAEDHIAAVCRFPLCRLHCRCMVHWARHYKRSRSPMRNSF